jgi:hypothetical protein
MSRFIVTLSDEERAQLEAIRSANGLRSQADAVRWLIFVEAGRMAPADPAEVNRIAVSRLKELKASLALPPVPYGSRLKKR